MADYNRAEIGRWEMTPGAGMLPNGERQQMGRPGGSTYSAFPGDSRSAPPPLPFPNSYERVNQPPDSYGRYGRRSSAPIIGPLAGGYTHAKPVRLEEATTYSTQWRGTEPEMDPGQRGSTGQWQEASRPQLPVPNFAPSSRGIGQQSPTFPTQQSDSFYDRGPYRSEYGQQGGYSVPSESSPYETRTRGEFDSTNRGYTQQTAPSMPGSSYGTESRMPYQEMERAPPAGHPRESYQQQPQRSDVYSPNPSGYAQQPSRQQPQPFSCQHVGTVPGLSQRHQQQAPAMSRSYGDPYEQSAGWQQRPSNPYDQPPPIRRQPWSSEPYSPMPSNPIPISGNRQGYGTVYASSAPARSSSTPNRQTYSPYPNGRFSGPGQGGDAAASNGANKGRTYTCPTCGKVYGTLGNMVS